MGKKSGSTAFAWQGVAVLCLSADRRALLMVLQGRPGETPTWAVPGGSVELDETPEEAAVRETKEETGLDIRILRLYTVVEGVRKHGAFRVFYFEGEVVGGRLCADDPDGLIRRVSWLPVDRLPGLPLSHEDQRHIVEEVLRDHF